MSQAKSEWPFIIEVMSRPRGIPDEAVLKASSRVLARLGPNQFTLADIAKEAGLAPATLIQRFGSKRGLLLALNQLAAESAGACFARVRSQHRSPLRALMAAVEEMAGMAESPEVLANSLGFLQMDLTDAEFRRWSLVNARATTEGFGALLDDAVRAKELRVCDTRALARLIQAAVHGSMVCWAVYQEGDACEWVRRDLEMLLAPYQRKRSTRRKS